MLYREIITVPCETQLYKTCKYTLQERALFLDVKAGVRPEALMAAKVNKIFPGYWWCYMVNSGQHFRDYLYLHNSDQM